jgi:hypothetical protein
MAVETPGSNHSAVARQIAASRPSRHWHIYFIIRPAGTNMIKIKMRSLFAVVLSFLLLPVATLAGDISGLIESCSG